LFIDIVVNRIEINEIKMIVTLKQKQYNFISRWWNSGIGGKGVTQGSINESLLDKIENGYYNNISNPVSDRLEQLRKDDYTMAPFHTGRDAGHGVISEIYGKYVPEHPTFEDPEYKENSKNWYKNFDEPYQGLLKDINTNTPSDEIIRKRVKDLKTNSKLNLSPEDEERLINELLKYTHTINEKNTLFDRSKNLTIDHETILNTGRGSAASPTKDLVNKIKGLKLTDQELQKLVSGYADEALADYSKFIKRRNLTRAGMITTGVGAVGAGGYGLYKHFKNKKENNLNTKL
jgi:hypothetical protein